MPTLGLGVGASAGLGLSASAGLGVSAGAGLSVNASAGLGLGLNAAFSLTTNLLGARTDPYTGFNFLVEIEGLVIGGFTDVSGLAMETTVQEYQEGGQNEYVHKLPGPTRYPQNLVLKRGLTDLDMLGSWYQAVTIGQVERRNGTIYLLDRQGTPVVGWDFKEAYPVKWTGPDLKAESNTVATESLELVHRGLAKSAVSGLLAGVAGTLSAAVGANLNVSLGGSIGL
jgi:phage tail-like protein